MAKQPLLLARGVFVGLFVTARKYKKKPLTEAQEVCGVINQFQRDPWFLPLAAGFLACALVVGSPFFADVAFGVSAFFTSALLCAAGFLPAFSEGSLSAVFPLPLPAGSGLVCLPCVATACCFPFLGMGFFGYLHYMVEISSSSKSSSPPYNSTKVGI